MDYRVVFYENEYGKAPAYDFIKQLAPKQRAIIEGVLKILEEKGPSIREPYCKHLGEGLYELRCMLGGRCCQGAVLLFQGRDHRSDEWVHQEKCEDPEKRARESQTLYDCFSFKGVAMNIDDLRTLDDLHSESMQNPEYAEAWENLQPELAVIRAIIDARSSLGLTQQQVAERTGIAQTEISKLENGTRNPSIKLLQRLAAGLGYTLKIEFVPKLQA